MKSMHHAYSLIEVLIVFAVIAVIAACLMPVLVAAHKRSDMIKCQSNLHQIGLALKMYSIDNDGDYPVDNRNKLQAKHQVVWDELFPYTHSTSVFHCPNEIGPVERALGYEYRTGLHTSRSYQWEKAPRPNSGTVVAFCGQHAKRIGPDGWELDSTGHVIGPVNIVREDGSTKTIRGNQIDFYAFAAGQWSLLDDHICPDTAQYCYARYPGEEWPPEVQE